MRTQFINTLCQLAETNEQIFLVTGDLGFSVLEDFAERFPGRYLNAGIAEQNMTGVAAGLALSGKSVLTYSIANFPTFRCLEQIRNDVCYHDADVTVVAVGGGLVYGTQGYTHHGIEDLAVMRVLPGMTVVAPGDPVETEQLLPQIIARKGPCYLRLGRGGEPVVHNDTDHPPVITLGRAFEARSGTALTLISTGGMLKPAMDAADTLAKNGIEARVLSMHTISPVDHEAIAAAGRETGGIITLEEHVVDGGLGTVVADSLVQSGISIRMRKIGVIPSMIGMVGSQAFLRALMGDIVEAGREMVVTGR